MHLAFFFFHLKICLGGLLWCPLVKNPLCNAGDMGFIPGLGIKILHAIGQLSPWITTTEPALWNKRSHTNSTACILVHALLGKCVGHTPGGGIAGSMGCVFNLLTYAPRPSREAGSGSTPASRRTEFQPLHPLGGTRLLAINPLHVCFLIPAHINVLTFISFLFSWARSLPLPLWYLETEKFSDECYCYCFASL